MELRQNELSDLRTYIGGFDSEVTLMLQHVQWDRKNMGQGPSMMSCKYNSSHQILVENKEAHEQQCYLRANGYSTDDKFLSDGGENNNGINIKLDKEQTCNTIDAAAKNDPLFKRVFILKDSGFTTLGNESVEPLTLDRLQVAYTADERRAIYDAVVNAAPAVHDLADLALSSANGEKQINTKPKTRLEILAELRDMKRRRTKYRVAAKTQKYSNVLRDVIKTQMEIYTNVQDPDESRKDPTPSKIFKNIETSSSHENSRESYNSYDNCRRDTDRYNRHNQGKSKDRSSKGGSEDRDVKPRSVMKRKYRNNDEQSTERHSKGSGNSKYYRTEVKTEKGYKQDVHYSASNCRKVSNYNQIEYNSTTSDKDRECHRNSSSSCRKRKHRDEEDIVIKKEHSSNTSSSDCKERARYYESSYNSSSSRHNDIPNRHESVAKKSRHNKPRDEKYYHNNGSTDRDLGTKYERYYDMYPSKDKKSRFDCK